MKFEEVLPALKDGKKVRKNYWCKDTYIYIDSNGKFVTQSDNHFDIIFNSLRDLEDDKWEIVKEKKKVKLRDLTPEQMQKWKDTNCISNKCNDCVFKKDNCVYLAYCLIKDKSLFSDKFLDQEIEIEK